MEVEVEVNVKGRSHKKGMRNKMDLEGYADVSRVEEDEEDFAPGSRKEKREERRRRTRRHKDRPIELNRCGERERSGQVGDLEARRGGTRQYQPHLRHLTCRSGAVEDRRGSDR